jgi:hypothetical protein
MNQPRIRQQQRDDPAFPQVTYRRGASGIVTLVVRGTGIRVQTLILMKAWYAYMEEHLDFPFKAEVDEYQSRGPMRSGDRVRVLDLVMADDMYGLIVGLRHKRQHYDFPLGDLAVLDTRSENHRIVQAYRVWFANR